MAEGVLAEKFVMFYYHTLAYNPTDLRLLYSNSSIVKIHDLIEDTVKYTGRDQIMNGLKRFGLFNAVANLENGSIDCVHFAEKDFLLTVNGVFKIQERKRQFNQIFILSQLQTNPYVFYVKSEIITLYVNFDNKDEIEALEKISAARALLSHENAGETSHESNPRGSANESSSYARNSNRDSIEGSSYENRVNKEKPMKPTVEIIFAKNLPDGVVEDDIREVFKKYGEICQIKMFPEKRYSTVSFNKTDGDYTTHEVFDRIMEENKEFRICGEIVRLEPFSLAHKKQNFARYPTNRYHPRITK